MYDTPYNGLFSLSANFPKFPEWPHNSGNSYWAVFVVQLWVAKEYYNNEHLSYLLPVLGVYKVLYTESKTQDS